MFLIVQKQSFSQLHFLYLLTAYQKSSYSPKRDGRYSDPAWDESSEPRRDRDRRSTTKTDRWGNSEYNNDDDYYNRRRSGGYRDSTRESFSDRTRNDSYNESRNGDRSTWKRTETTRREESTRGPIITDLRSQDSKWNKYKTEPIYTQDQVRMIH